MGKTVKVTAAVGIVFLMTAAIAGAYSNSLATPGKYRGNTEVNEPVILRVVKEGGKKIVDKVIVDQTSTECEKTVIKKDAVIKKGEFRVRGGGLVVDGVWTIKGGLAGGIQGNCVGTDLAGKDNRYTAGLVGRGRPAGHVSVSQLKELPRRAVDPGNGSSVKQAARF